MPYPFELLAIDRLYTEEMTVLPCISTLELSRLQNHSKPATTQVALANLSRLQKEAPRLECERFTPWAGSRGWEEEGSDVFNTHGVM